MKLQILENEYWWGGIVHEGIRMPFGREDSGVLDFREQATQNQVTPLLLSSAGRYVWGEKPFAAVFENGSIRIDGEAALREGYENLRARIWRPCGRISRSREKRRSRCFSQSLSTIPGSS